MKIYRPDITHNVIYSPHAGKEPYLQYNHDVDIIRFKDRFFAAWNANEADFDDLPGQYNYLSHSLDFEHWSAPVKLFSSEAGCKNPVESDNQWQPGFANWRDETLFCAWCDFKAGRTMIASSSDGINWENRDVQSAPDSLLGQAIGFPTNHGLVTNQNVIMFPCSLPFIDKTHIVGNTLYAGILYSCDGGESWQWSEPIEGMTWSEMGVDIPVEGRDRTALWEPTLFEQNDGKIGLLIRNSSAQDCPALDEYMKPHHMVLYSTSADHGKSWTKCRPVEVDGIISRFHANSGVNGRDSLVAIMNDWQVNVPNRIGNDRYFLSLFCAPVCEPDLLLPGPMIQPEGGRAYYPNGFVYGDKMYVAYSYPNSIMGTIVEELPDFSSSFLMPRPSRGEVIDEKKQWIKLRQTWSSCGLVLAEDLLEQDEIKLSFNFYTHYRRENDITLLTVGGKTRLGGQFVLHWDGLRGADTLIYESANGSVHFITCVPERTDFLLELVLRKDGIAVYSGEKLLYQDSEKVLRKLCFGGLYADVQWPLLCQHEQEVRIDINSITVK